MAKTLLDVLISKHIPMRVAFGLGISDSDSGNLHSALDVFSSTDTVGEVFGSVNGW